MVGALVDMTLEKLEFPDIFMKHNLAFLTERGKCDQKGKHKNVGGDLLKILNLAVKHQLFQS